VRNLCSPSSSIANSFSATVSPTSIANSACNCGVHRSRLL
jgi:hypothetical protein